MEPEQLGWEPIFTSWIENLPPYIPAALRTALTELVMTFAPPLLSFVRKRCKEVDDRPYFRDTGFVYISILFPLFMNSSLSLSISPILQVAPTSNLMLMNSFMRLLLILFKDLESEKNPKNIEPVAKGCFLFALV